MQVWIITKGEDSEGGNVLGVYADRDSAFGAFVTEAQQIHNTFTVDRVEPDEDGSVYVHGGCDWLSLDPHQVVGRLQLTSP